MNDTVLRNVTPEVVSGSYERLMIAQEEVYLAGVVLNAAKTVYEKLKMDSIMGGSNKGKNPAEREIYAQQEWPHYYEALTDATIRFDRAKYFLSLAQLQVDEVRLLMRVDELTHNIRPGEGH